MRRTFMKSSFGTMLIATATLWPALAFASPDDEAGGLFSSGVLVELGLLILVAACALTAFKVYGSVRGGRIAEGWQWFSMGFIIFAVAQVLSIGSQADLIPVSAFWIGILRVGALAVIFLGAVRMRRLLA